MHLHGAPVRLDGYHSVPIGAPEGYPLGPKPGQDARVGMAVAVLAHANHRHLRLQLSDPRSACGTGRAMVAHLQHIDRAYPPLQQCLDRQARIAGKERLEVSILDQEHDRVLIEICTPSLPRAVGMDDRELYPIDVHPLARPRRLPENLVSFQGSQEFPIHRVGNGEARLDRHTHGKLLEHSSNSAKMVGMRMRHQHHVERLGSMSSQEWDDAATAGVESIVPRARIHDDPPSPGRANGSAVTLAHIEKM